MLKKVSEIAILNKESYKKAEMIGAYRYLDTASLTENFIAKYIDLNGKENNIPSRARRKVEPNDILVSTVRPTQKHFGIIEQPVQNLVASTGFVTITPNSQLVNPYYLYILLTQEKVTNYLQVIAENSTSAYPSIKPSVIADLEFKFPERDIQDKIANLYKAIEGKIKVNQQINDNLAA
ncbi:restriction endonuclease subunit S [Trichococcus pasteurii]|uniref:Restriction endonuclease type i hsds n=1 Tax=Trichococcus pasteurii TaxID=43064 RepID=A0A1W1ICC6_9LACT|nr:restriction endonuclease subunit S [Trichococcus pasteurii]SFE27472.1 type I restriction enzyme, S subunit [Trichococcus pasteurii]SLM50551.1 restriction endonuclease type i hsds [Trichococcus pasteurii]SSB91432.1 restriction endonuclease type i hsds [Trichococcus pasteurii]